MNDADALGHTLTGQAVLGHELGQAALLGLELVAQKTWLQLLYELLDGDKGQNFFLG